MYYGTGDPTKWAQVAVSAALNVPRESIAITSVFSLPRFRVKYRNICLETPCVCPVLDTVIRAHDAEQARERFESSLDADGWEIVSVVREPKRGGVRS